MKAKLTSLLCLSILLIAGLLAQGLSATEETAPPAADPVAPVEQPPEAQPDEDDTLAEETPERVNLSASCPPLADLDECYYYCDVHEDRCVDDCVLYPSYNGCVNGCYAAGNECRDGCHDTCS